MVPALVSFPSLCFSTFNLSSLFCCELSLFTLTAIDKCATNNGGCEDLCTYLGPGNSICDCSDPQAKVENGRDCTCPSGFDKVNKTCVEESPLSAFLPYVYKAILPAAGILIVIIIIVILVLRKK